MLDLSAATDEVVFDSSPSPALTAGGGSTDVFLLGTEVEYAPLVSASDREASRLLGPVWASSAVVRSYLGLGLPEVLDYSSPEFFEAWSDAYRSSRLFRSPRVPGLVAGFPVGMPSAFLGNGGRLYVDHAHPEYSTPECGSPLEAVHAELAGDLIVSEGARLASELLAASDRRLADARVRVFKSNSDGKGHSWGAHENYLLSRRVSIPYVTATTLGFFVTRQIFCGAGKVGSENGRPGVSFQLSQRSDFFTQIMSLQTTHDRGIINTRDEPHADPGRFRRLHVICGDANLSPYALWLKLGSTALVLLAAQAGAFESLADWVQFADPVDAIWRISHDFDFSETYPTREGFEVSALDIASMYLSTVVSFVESHQVPGWASEVVAAWTEVLDLLALDPLVLADRLDWAAKFRILAEAGVDLGSSKARAADVVYHELGSGFAAKLSAEGMWRLPPGFDSGEVVRLVSGSPATRARLRAGVVADESRDWVGMDWSEAVSAAGERVSFPVD